MLFDLEFILDVAVANGKTHSECINMVNSAYVKGHVYDNDLVKWLDYVDEMFFSM